MTGLKKDELDYKLTLDNRQRVLSRLQTTFDLIAKLPEDEDTFLVRAEKCNDDLLLFESIQEKLARYNVTLKQNASIDETALSYDDLHFRILGKAQQIKREREAQETAQEDQRSRSNATVFHETRDFQEARTLRPNLPPIVIPKFKGDIEKFPAFRSLFDTLVHRTELAPIQKFAFLKSYLEYPALSVLDHYEFTGENYPLAYDKLVKRYTDTRLVGTHLLNKLLLFKPLPNGSLHSLRQFADIFCVHYASLKSLDVPDLADFIVFTVAMKVLDNDTKRLFEEKFSDKEFPSYDDLASFVTNKSKLPQCCRPLLLSLILIQVVQPSLFSQSHSLRIKLHLRLVLPDPIASSVLVITESIHVLSKHARDQCTSKLNCRQCQSASHHTLLHRDSAPTQDNLQSPPATKKDSASGSTTNTLNCRINAKTEAFTPTSLLSTVVARVLNCNGKWVSCRLVIDPASESSFITESFVQTLGLKRRSFPIDIVGIGSSSFSNHRGAVSIQLTPSHVDEPILEVDTIILSTITSNLPRYPLSPEILKKFRHLRLADPHFDQPSRVDILLGVRHYDEILTKDTSLISGSPAALNSIFGFIVFGKIPSPSASNTTTSFLTHTPPLDTLLQRFWEDEECMDHSKSIAVDTECENFFQQTTTRDDLGRYQVSLPFKHPVRMEDLGSTRNIAHKRLLSLERRLARQPEFQEQYQANLRDYVAQDHIRVASSPSEYLLTHHAVVKESTTTKVRVVFNGSERSNNSHSLNSFLRTGPKLQSDISLILLKFRLHPVTLTADIRQMFRCIRLNPDARQFTHILWREHYTSPILEWEFTTLPFGLTCSPYLAQRVIQKLVEEEGDSYPLASEMLQKNLYVDDLIASVPSEADAITLFREVTDLLNRGGFQLRKFSSNNANVLSNIPIEHQEGPLSFDESHFIKLLGLVWDPVSDEFTYQHSTLSCASTKRGILSQAARIFDIQGFIAPIIFWIKCFLQHLWKDKLGWDDPLSDELLDTWSQFSCQLPELNTIRLKRYLSTSSNSELSVIGFCDASEKGYGACVYLVVRSEEGATQSYLLKAKSKVAPLKTITIPRLELNGALLLTKLMSSMRIFLSMLPPYRFLCCTDSTVVLAWLNPAHHLKTYVSHRVVGITDSIEPSLWWHVSGCMNPADVASRGAFPRDLISNSLWWHGPKFFTLPFEEWPLDKPQKSKTPPELKSEVLTLIVNPTHNKDSTAEVVHEEDPYPLVEYLISRYSSLSRIQRVIAWIRRFSFNSRKVNTPGKSGPLSLEELNQSMEIIIRWTQNHYYSEVIKGIKAERVLKGPMKLLTPFLDSKGLLRVGGRLSLSSLPYSSRHPFLIPRQSILAKLICIDAHALTLHGGIRLMQSIIFNKFWIVGIRYLLRTILSQCMTCYRYRARPLEPLMSDIPTLRFHKSRAFINTGVDLAGPYIIKESKRRNSRTYKGWIVLFICLVTRAVYIDLVSDLSSDCFLAALDRFIARRGIPSTLCSDLGTNFVGAARELRELIELLRGLSDAIRAYCDQREIKWEFNPPAAPNFGGGWEAAIKSMKYHLRRVIGQISLTHEAFLTLLARVEGILNSRPLCQLSSTPSDGFDVLTPGHFLVGAPILLSRPEPDYDNQRIDFRSRWELLSRSVQDIWKRWSNEYLHTLMQRSKWSQPTPNIRIGQLVLVQEKSLPPCLWSLGRILEVLPGRDDVVRVVRLQTPHGTFTRPVNKLCPLPLPADD